MWRDGRAGLRRVPGKCVCPIKASGVRIPLSPPSMIDGELAMPCNLRFAIAGLNSRRRIFVCIACPKQVAVTTGSHTMYTCESCQVLTEAALSKLMRVLWGCLI